MSRIYHAATLALVAALSASITTASAREFKSSSAQVSLLELYTSEGCSSCPRADRWLSELTQDNRLWRDVVPVAFHVDYWDYIGWKDRFADPSYSERQQLHHHYRNIATVYTPGFVVAGDEWRGWFSNPTLNLAMPEVGPLTVDVGDDMAKITFAPSNPENASMRVHVALLGFDLNTAISAGENHGKTLEHDFVVLGTTTADMDRNGEAFHASAALPTPSVSAPRMALAAWVSTGDNPRPLQAVGGWLD